MKRPSSLERSDAKIAGENLSVRSIGDRGFDGMTIGSVSVLEMLPADRKGQA